MNTGTRNLLAAALLVTGLAAGSTYAASATPDACTAALDLADQLPEHHGRLTGSTAALNIATKNGWADHVAKLGPKVTRLQADYAEALAAYQHAAADCRA